MRFFSRKNRASQLTHFPPGFVPHRILICRPNGRLGNTLLVTPLIQELERLFPGAEIDILSAYPATADIVETYDCVRRIYQLPQHGMRRPVRWLRTLLDARKARYDLVIDPCRRSWSSRFLTRLLRGRHSLGFMKDHPPTTITVARDEAPVHLAQSPVYLLRSACGASDGKGFPPLSIQLTNDEQKWGERKLLRVCGMDQRNAIIVAVFAAATGRKQLPASWWETMLAELEAQYSNVQVIEVLPASGNRFLQRPGYYSTDIRRMAAVINAADLFVSADCGVMHLASSTRTQTIGLFSVTKPWRYQPYGGQNAGLTIDPQQPVQTAREIAKLIQLARGTPKATMSAVAAAK